MARAASRLYDMLEPLEGTLPEPEIWARLVRALGVVDEAELAPLRAAAREGREAYAIAFARATTENTMLSTLAPYVLYETLGPTLPDGLQAAAAVWGLAHRCAMTYPDAVRRAGHADGNALTSTCRRASSPWPGPSQARRWERVSICCCHSNSKRPFTPANSPRGRRRSPS